jgi:hypothetical protein
LGHPGEAGSGDAVLAGRFAEADVDMAVELVQSAGGEIVADIDERHTGVSGGGSSGLLN